MKKDFVMPILNLLILCLIISGLLAVGNDITKPVIETAAAQRAEDARKDIIPQAEEFVPIDIEGLPKTITQVYGTNNNTGYIFMITSIGYGGEVNLICGIDPEGHIIKTATLSETETKGIATPVFAMESDYIGKDKNLTGIDAISGATITSNAYMNGIHDAFEAYELVKGVQS